MNIVVQVKRLSVPSKAVNIIWMLSLPVDSFQAGFFFVIETFFTNQYSIFFVPNKRKEFVTLITPACVSDIAVQKEIQHP